MFWFAILLTIVSNVFYHIFQKITPQDANPVFALAISYLVAGLICLVLLIWFPLEEGMRQSLKQLNWATIGLAFTLVGLELGFLLAYRGRLEHQSGRAGIECDCLRAAAASRVDGLQGAALAGQYHWCAGDDSRAGADELGEMTQTRTFGEISDSFFSRDDPGRKKPPLRWLCLSYATASLAFLAFLPRVL